MKGFKPYLIFATFVIAFWTFAVSANGWHNTYTNGWVAALTMVFGSFIAGASAEGGGAIAFPVFTLLLKIPPTDAKQFSFAIQSIGMVSASLLIIGRKVPIQTKAIIYPSCSGIVGLLFGHFFIAPLLSPAPTKLFFVSLWLAFGFSLWRSNAKKRKIVDDLPKVFTAKDYLVLLSTGFIGGIVTSIFGNGIDIVTFCVVTMWYALNEKVATPSSVILMSVLTVCGFVINAVTGTGISDSTYTYWIAAIPVALIAAPLGALVISGWTRSKIIYLLYIIIVAQFVGAIVVLGPSAYNIIFCSIITLLGIGIMYLLELGGLKQQRPQ